MVNKKDIISIITSDDTLEQKVTALIETANNNGGNDNITVVLVKNDKAPQRVDVARPLSAEKKNIETNRDTVIVRDEKPQAHPSPVAPVKKGTSLTLILGLICLGLLASSVWLYQQWQKNKPAEKVTTTRAPRNEQELLLQDAFDNAKGHTLVLSDSIFKSPIIISDTLFIKDDSVFIKAKGNIVLQRDTAYHGPAIVISPTAKLTVLDSLQFNDFATAIYVNNTALVIKNTRFAGSTMPVINRYSFGGKAIVTAGVPVLRMPSDTVNIRRVNTNGTR
jgi:hypothetical protein